MMTEHTDTESSLIKRILIADDHSIVRRGIKQILLTGFSALDFGEAGSGQAVLEAVGSGHWDLLILDLSLPDRNGLDLVPELRRLAPELRVLVLTMHPEEQYALRLFRSGVSGYLTKDSATDQLIEAATKVLAGGKYLSPEMAERMAQTLDGSQPGAPHEALSTREF
jgi:DNA-binding NarL/FixJ family response regulator